MDTNGYVAFLILGVVLVAIDGVIVYRTGRAYLDEAYQNPRASRSMVQLVTVLFHLVVLGVLAAAHAATMTILSRIRDRLREERLTDELVEQNGSRAQSNQSWPPTVNPGTTEDYRHPAVSPPIEETNPTNPHSPTV